MKSEFKFSQQAIEGCSVGIFVIDEQLQLVDYNQSFANLCDRLFAVKPSRGLGLLDSVDKPARTFWQGLFDRGFAGESFLALGPKTGDCSVELEIKPLSGSTQGLICYVQDTSRWRRREAELQEQIHCRDVLMAAVGHDLRTPVFQLNGLVYLMRNLPSGLEPEKLQNHLIEVEGNLNYLTEAIENLLRWSSNHRNGSGLERRPVSADELWRQTCRLLRPIADEKEIQLEEVQPGVPLIDVDADMLAFVFRNLLSNALKFSGAGSSVELNHALTDGCYQFAVVDHGIGMSASELENLTCGTPGRSRLGTKGEKGFGLGLRLCMDFVSAHSGELEFKQTPGGGLTVWVSIPVSSSMLTQTTVTGPRKEIGSGTRIP